MKDTQETPFSAVYGAVLLTPFCLQVAYMLTITKEVFMA